MYENINYLQKIFFELLKNTYRFFRKPLLYCLWYFLSFFFLVHMVLKICLLHYILLGNMYFIL